MNELELIQNCIDDSVEMLTGETSRLHRLLAMKAMLMLGVERSTDEDLG